MKTKAINTIMATLLIASMLSMAFNVATVFAKTIAIDGLSQEEVVKRLSHN